MYGVWPRATTGRPAFRAALVSIEIKTLTRWRKISNSNAFTAPSAPLPSSATSSVTLWLRMPPLALISASTSWAAWTTEGATTLLAPLSPTGTPMLIAPSAASAEGAAAPSASASTPAASVRAASTSGARRGLVARRRWARRWRRCGRVGACLSPRSGRARAKTGQRRRQRRSTAVSLSASIACNKGARKASPADAAPARGGRPIRGRLLPNR